jgi:hypothetical protein
VTKKPAKMTLRKPPSPHAVDAFVAGARPAPRSRTSGRQAVQTPSTSDVHARRAAVIERKNGVQVRRTTVYFPLDLAQQLAVYCATHDVDLSQVASTALAEYLARKSG